MTHPMDRVYRFETPAQWGAGTAVGLRIEAGSGLEAALVTPGALIAEMIPGTSGRDRFALLARDPAGRLVWLNRDGGAWVRSGEHAVRIARIPEHLARTARRLIWGQSFAWLLTVQRGPQGLRRVLLRLDVGTGARLGEFARGAWQPEAIVEDGCDGVFVIELKPRSDEPPRIRRLRADGVAHPTILSLKTRGLISAARRQAKGHLVLVQRDPGGGAGRLLRVDWETGRFESHAIPPEPALAPRGPVAHVPGEALALLARDRERVVELGAGRLGPPRRPSGTCGIGRISDLIHDGDVLVAASETGLYRLTDDPGEADAQRAVWLSPVLRSHLGERQGWLRADLAARLPEGAEITISAAGFEAQGQARDRLLAYRSGAQDPRDDAPWAEARISRHFGPAGGGQIMCRHYLGEIEHEFLVLRITAQVPACQGPVALNALRVLYPNRSLIEALPAVYQDGERSERQMRRALAGFQALLDELDDAISAAVHRVDPAKADALWAGFLLHWLGHGELARLPVEDRQRLLRALPRIMALRGTMAGLDAVLRILAPGGFQIEDSGAGPGDWLLPALGDPAGARLGQNTRAAPFLPKPWRLGGRHHLGGGVLKGDVCRSDTAPDCSSDVTVRLFGAGARKTLGPFTDAIARVFAPAHARVSFVFGAHRPIPGLGHGPGLDDIVLDTGGSRAAGAWILPEAGTRAAPSEPARLDHATLNGNLVLE